MLKYFQWAAFKRFAKVWPNVFWREPHDMQRQRIDRLGQLVLSLHKVHLFSGVQVLHLDLLQNFLEQIDKVKARYFLAKC